MAYIMVRVSQNKRHEGKTINTTVSEKKNLKEKFDTLSSFWVE